MKSSSLATWSGKNRIFAHVLARGKKDDCSNKMLGDGIKPTGGTDLAPVEKERISSSVMENLQIVSSLGSFSSIQS